jgi:hypothetical protein
MTKLNKATLNALAGGRHGNPFSLFGLHNGVVAALFGRINHKLTV